MIFETKVPDPQSAWRLHLIWQPKPSRVGKAYARGFDGLSRLLDDPIYLVGWVPSTRVWNDIVTTPETPDTESTLHQMRLRRIAEQSDSAVEQP